MVEMWQFLAVPAIPFLFFQRESTQDDLVLTQVLRNNVSGLTGLSQPASASWNILGTQLMTATLGNGDNGGLVVLDNALPVVGNELREREEFAAADQLFVLNEPFPETEGVISTWSYRPNDGITIDFTNLIIPLLLEQVGSSWTITARGKSQRMPGGGEVRTQDFDVQSGSADVSGKYFGWYKLVNDEVPAGVLYDDDTAGSVIQLATPVDEDNIVVGAQFSEVATLSRTYSIQATATFNEPSVGVAAEFKNIEALGVSTGAGLDSIELTTAPGPNVATTSIDSGESDDTVSLFDLSATTNVNLGAGNDIVDINVNSGSDLTIYGDAGEDIFNINEVSATTTTMAFGDDEAEAFSDNDTFNVNGSGLALGATTVIDGNGPTVAPGDNLFYNQAGTDTAVDNGGVITMTGQSDLAYSDIENVVIESGPVITFADPTPSIDEGEDLNLTLTIVANGLGTLSGPVGS